jgi:hypothetical protein
VSRTLALQPSLTDGLPQVETDRVVVVDQQLALITLPGLFDSQPKGFGAFPSAIAAWADPPYLSTLHPSPTCECCRPSPSAYLPA